MVFIIIILTSSDTLGSCLLFSLFFLVFSPLGPYTVLIIINDPNRPGRLRTFALLCSLHLPLLLLLRLLRGAGVSEVAITTRTEIFRKIGCTICHDENNGMYVW